MLRERDRILVTHSFINYIREIFTDTQSLTLSADGEIKIKGVDFIFKYLIFPVWEAEWAQ